MTQPDHVTGDLHNWMVHKRLDGKQYATGMLMNDRRGRFPDCSQIRTSMIIQRNADVIITLNSVYRLVGTGNAYDLEPSTL